MNIATLHHYFLQSNGISTDTRKIFRDCLFFALKGENFNGNLFAQEALDKGAFKVVVDEEVFHKSNGETILVENVLLALQQLASFHRKYLALPIISLTGSNGKTTSKELINAVLSQKFNTVATEGNLNNHIGVPLTLMKMNKQTEIGIVEMGANHLGEIKLLSEIAQPDYGYITNFGKAHLEGFGSLEGVVQGKTELYQFLKKHNKKVFVNANDPKQMTNSEEIDRITFGTEQSDFNIQLLDSSHHLLVAFDGTNIQSNLVGAYNFVNLSAAIAIGSYFKVSSEKIKAGIEAYVPSNNRSQLIKKGSNSILMDAYNANPTSMLAALENFKHTHGGNKILFLGDMFELGKDANKEHQNIVNFLIENPFGKVYLIGSNFFKTSNTASHIRQFETFEELKKELISENPSNATILIKGSRGMALERVLDVI
ncbi:MAG TPA: UDP-N-acetylmuramoyl-tripeptide--D-alanyl-D-alanine ligase [Aequorivita sp.]|nr:UDP-N-acetylmuramoyl-tripeptide--D-alanyl-D-alanine ligase [Aequorivita sp.]MBP40354.1 UDP-N-acetylmuramoyl-tripeptide--D-alanyl-D-alanine ligase [Aequorivita sp.]HBC05728.1 UDP-N-acetylmuramoyl-tripeptide--D-alanyl-D-alanine ligase [Aequorivita sp.]HNP67073.1 UDP-N-acetylmuramoyl-tripeptide--D-alanyl-D-alanine ligase [Aequorivita sp.]|tara:strand:- start:17791 stop:19071 length:1281 start_codon:yes stop_codon:yes gene_type:complete